MVTHPSTCFGANYSVASFKTWSTSIFYPEMGIMSVREGSKNYYLLSKENILNGRRQTAPNPISPQRHAISSTWLVEKYPTHPYCFTMIWWPEVVGCTRNKYIVRSPIPALKRRDDSNIATSVNSGVPSSQSWSKSIYNPGNKRPPKTTASFQNELKHVYTDRPAANLSQWQAPKFAHGWFRTYCSPTYIHYDWVVNALKIKYDSKISHRSTIWYLGGLTSEFPWNPDYLWPWI